MQAGRIAISKSPLEQDVQDASEKQELADSESRRRHFFEERDSSRLVLTRKHIIHIPRS